MMTPHVSAPEQHKPRIVGLPGSSHHEWRVMADWMGAVRCVFIGTMYECVEYICAHLSDDER